MGNAQFIPISMSQRNLFEESSKANYSLYFKNMYGWKLKENSSELEKDTESIEAFSSYAQKVFKDNNELKAILENLHSRQKNLLKNLSEKNVLVWEFKATLSSAFISGLGSGHPSETGMTLDRNTGLPYIPATSIKGVLRLAHACNIAPQLEKDNSEYWGKNEVEVKDNEPSMRKYFGDIDSGPSSARGQLVFLDSFPAKTPEIKTDIMNPHFVEYYGGKKPPVETESPVPIKFLSVKEGAEFIFRGFVKKLSPVNSKETKAPSSDFGDNDLLVIKKMYQTALLQIGLGAKTAAGYGRFCNFDSTDLVEELEEEKKKQAQEEKAQKEAQRIKSLPKDEQWKEKFENTVNEKKDKWQPLIKEVLDEKELLTSFFVWLKELLVSENEWSTKKPEKNKKSKRCREIQKIIDEG